MPKANSTASSAINLFRIIRPIVKFDFEPEHLATFLGSYLCSQARVKEAETNNFQDHDVMLDPASQRMRQSLSTHRQGDTALAMCSRWPHSCQLLTEPRPVCPKR